MEIMFLIRENPILIRKKDSRATSVRYESRLGDSDRI